MSTQRSVTCSVSQRKEKSIKTCSLRRSGRKNQHEHHEDFYFLHGLIYPLEKEQRKPRATRNPAAHAPSAAASCCAAFPNRTPVSASTRATGKVSLTRPGAA